MAAYYNEIDPEAAKWLRNLIAAGHIAPGDVDERSILDVKPSDLSGYTQCHFFAGIGIWSLALRRAGWPDDRPVWTGSCPCQPFSSAGKSAGFADERHLWPYWHHLIRVLRPGRVFGEQVAGKDGLGWLDLVQADLEGEDYAVAPVDLCAAGVGSPNIRQRLWFVAERLEHTGDEGPQGRLLGRPSAQWQDEYGHPRRDGAVGRVANATHEQHDGAWLHGTTGRAEHPDSGAIGRVADPDDDRQPPGRLSVRLGRQDEAATLESGRGEGRQPRPTNGFWRNADWLFCRDGEWRPVEPGTFPLAHGDPTRVVRLRAYGNAINAEAATTFIESYRDVEIARMDRPADLIDELI